MKLSGRHRSATAIATATSEFYRRRSKLYDEKHARRPLDLDAIWPGESLASVDAPHPDRLSPFRQRVGSQGRPRRTLPRTLWVIDYPQLERIYYALVAGFDVFGNVSHQVNVRRYMDYLRIEGELNFLEFMPQALRVSMLQSWYVGDRAIENVDHDLVRSNRPTKVHFKTDDPKRELLERLVASHFLPATGIAFDEINYNRSGREVPMPTRFDTVDDIKNGFRALTKPGTAFIRHVHGYQANVLFVRVRDFKGADRSFTIVVNRWHDNVNSMFREADTLDPSKDTMDFIRGSIGSYPNFFLDVPADEPAEFFDLLANFDGSPDYVRKLWKYGVNRSDADFWEAYDFFQKRLDGDDPLHAGLYDLNRYYSKAMPTVP